MAIERSGLTFKQRIGAAIMLAVVLVVLANEYFGWRMFGGYDRPAKFGIMIVALVVFLSLQRVRRGGTHSNSTMT